MDEEYFKEQSRRVRTIAENADPFTKKRLLALAESYDSRLGRPSRATRQLQQLPVDNKTRTDRHNGRDPSWKDGGKTG
jgi:hypothetical protein